MTEFDPCACLKTLDELLEWWKTIWPNISRGNQTKKCGAVAKHIANYREQLCRILTLRYILERQDAPDIDELRRLHPDLTRKFRKARDIYELRGDVDRELDCLKMGSGGGGFAVQVLVTKWFYEAGFRIVGVEVEHKDGGEHTFDIDIEDMNNNKWDVEVWHGTGPLAYEEMRTMTRGMYVRGEFCIDPGKHNPNMKYVTKYGGRGDDADANFQTLTSKMGQIRRDHTGVVVAYMQHGQRPWHTFIPKEWGPHLPENCCVVALQVGQGGFTEERRGIGYLVCSPKFGRVEEAKAMIKSLKFEYVEYPTVEM